MKVPIVVAEIGCNHKGEMSIARELIKTAAILCKADFAKFQKRSNRELLSDAEYRSPHPNPTNAYGKTYGEHREFLEFNLDQHKQLFDWCKEFGIGYACSAWDLTSAKELAALKPEYIKVPSATNLSFSTLQYLCEEYGGDIHISLGMTTHSEEQQIISLLREKKALHRTVIYSCTSGYPVPFEQVCLREITRLKEAYGREVRAVGFSGHHLGIATDVAAMTLGAEWVERHFTLDRTWKGTDHAASLEPNGLMKLVRDMHHVSKTLTYKESDILQIEMAQRKKLKKFS